MAPYIKAEFIKQKRGFHKVLVWVAPLLSVFMPLVLMGGHNLQSGGYNWWYIMLLPGCFTMAVALMVTRERKKNRHGMLGVAVHKNRLWIAQIVFGTGFLFCTCMYFFLFITIGGLLYGQELTIWESFVASILLFISFSWQIPLWMFLADRTGVFVTVMLGMGCNLLIPVFCATESCWWIPFAIPARFMCAWIHVLPNGLPVEYGNPLLDCGVILPGIMIAIGLYGLLTWLTAVWFDKQEV